MTQTDAVELDPAEPVPNGAAAATAGGLDQGDVGETGRRRFVRRMRKEKLALVALGYLLVVYAAAALAPVLAPYDPNKQSLSDRYLRPGSAHWLGTDDLGRDVFSRLLFAGRVSLVAGYQAVLLAVLIGVPLGLLAGYAGGKIDWVISRITDAFMAVPNLIFAIAIVGVLGPGLTNAMIAVGVLMAPSFLRLTRATTMVVREEEFISASKTIGTPTWRIILRHIVPNVSSTIIVQASIAIGLSMLVEAALSFLGLGARPPIGSWGSMLTGAFQGIYTEPLLLLWPALMIATTVLAYSLFGEGLRSALGKERRGRA